jgi:membrane-anchored glycerophosphoryl diester phosphodiesterase (GDPDase)
MYSAMPSLAWITAPITVALILVVSILFFFVMPIAILEEKGIVASMSESITLGLKHKNELLKVNLILMVLAIVTMLAGLMFESTGFIVLLALAGFVAIRLLQAILYTYMYVVNPYFYLKIKEV